jgi:hypothetical protein
VVEQEDAPTPVEAAAEQEDVPTSVEQEDVLAEAIIAQTKAAPGAIKPEEAEPEVAVGPEDFVDDAKVDVEEPQQALKPEAEPEPQPIMGPRPKQVVRPVAEPKSAPQPEKVPDKGEEEDDLEFLDI